MQWSFSTSKTLRDLIGRNLSHRTTWPSECRSFLWWGETDARNSNSFWSLNLVPFLSLISTSSSILNLSFLKWLSTSASPLSLYLLTRFTCFVILFVPSNPNYHVSDDLIFWSLLQTQLNLSKLFKRETSIDQSKNPPIYTNKLSRWSDPIIQQRCLNLYE